MIPDQKFYASHKIPIDLYSILFFILKLNFGSTSTPFPQHNERFHKKKKMLVHPVLKKRKRKKQLNELKKEEENKM